MTPAQAGRAAVAVIIAVALFVGALVALHAHKRNRFPSIDANGNPDIAIYRFME